jgi:outer membrane protein assembly factor BamB
MPRANSRTRSLRAVAAKMMPGVVLFGMLPWFAQGQVNVLTQHNDLDRSGTNLKETVLTPATVNAQHFGMLFKRVLDDQLYGQPLLVTNVKIGGGTHDVVFLTTVNNSVYAFDANDPEAAAPIWHVNFGTPANLYDAPFGCLDLNGNMGILGTPVIDPASGTLYVVSQTRAGGGFLQRLHALDIVTGADLPNSPATITAAEFDPLMQSQRPALLLSSGTVYIGYASHCDKGPYHGFLFGYDAKSLQQIAVLNTAPTGEGASIWHSGQAPAADAEGNVYVVTGNGSWDGKANFSESFLKLSPTLKLLDWFTPTNHFDLDRGDADLNSSGATLIPGTHLVVGGGKSGMLYSLDSRNFGHLGDEHAIQHFQATGSHLHSIVYWNSAKNGKLLYIWGQRDRERVYKFDGEKLNETPVMSRPEMNEGHPGAMLSLSANGNQDGILWAAIHASGDSWHESRPGILHAYDADDIGHELWNSLEDAKRDDCGNYAKMAPPTIANGKVYLASLGTENIGTGQFCVYGLLPSGAAPAPPANVKGTAEGGRVSLTWQGAGAGTTYRVGSASDPGGPFQTIAVGLTTPALEGIVVPVGAHYYTVTAVSSNGVSAPSAVASVVVRKPEAMPRNMVMH